MIRLTALMLLCCVAVPCMAQEKFKPKAGDRFTMVKNLTMANESIYLADLNKAFVAKDFEGLDKMEEDGKITSVKIGQSLTVLEVTTSPLVSAEFVECRLVVDGKAVSKVYLFSAFFSDKVMKREPAK